MGALCVGFAGSLPLGSCRRSPSPPSSPCVLNPPPATERPAIIIYVCGRETKQGGILTGRSILFGRPRLPQHPISFVFSDCHSSLHRPKLTCLQEYHADKPRRGQGSIYLGRGKRYARQTSPIVSILVVQRVHDGNRRKKNEAQWSSTPRHDVQGSTTGVNAANARLGPHEDLRRQERGEGTRG